MDCGGCITILENLIDMYRIRKLYCKRKYMIYEAKYPTNIQCFSLFTRRIYPKLKEAQFYIKHFSMSLYV